MRLVHAPNPQKIEIQAELGDVKEPYLGSPTSNLTWEGQISQGTVALQNTKEAAHDRRPWVRWTARALFFCFFIFPPLALIVAVLIGLT
jgi:hypothetical protein